MPPHLRKPGGSYNDDSRPPQPNYMNHESLRLFTQTPMEVESKGFEPSAIYLKRYSQFLEEPERAVPAQLPATTFSQHTPARDINVKNTLFDKHYSPHSYRISLHAIESEMTDSDDDVDMASVAESSLNSDHYAFSDITHTPTVMHDHSVYEPSVTTNTIAPWNACPGLPKFDTEINGDDPEYPGPPVYTPPMRAAMEANPETPMRIWAEIYYKTVCNELTTYRSYLSDPTKTRGTGVEKEWQNKVRFFESELVKATYQYKKTYKSKAEIEQLLRDHLENSTEQQESERRLSDQRWRALDKERREVNRKFVQEQLRRVEEAKAAKERHHREMDAAQRAIDEERTKLDSMIEAEEAQLLSEAQEAQRMIEEDQNDPVSESEWQQIKGKWDWMIQDMQDKQLRELQAAQDEALQIPLKQAPNATAYRQTSRHIAFADNVRVCNEHGTMEASLGNEGASPQSGLKRSRLGSVSKMWNPFKRSKK